MSTATTQPAPTVPPPMTGQPWDRQPNEGARPFAAFRCFIEMGDQRSNAKVARKLRKSSTIINRWSARWKWQERLGEWTAHMLKVQQDALEEEGRRRAKVWADREQKAREDQYELGQLMLSKAREMLAMPIRRRTSKCKGKTVVVEPVGFNLGQASRVSEVGQKLVNLSVGAPTERTALTDKDGGPVVGGTGAATVVIYLPEKEK